MSNLIRVVREIGTLEKSPINGHKRVFEKNGGDISDLRGRQFRKSDFDSFDRIYTMDETNHANILKLAKDEKQKSKVKMLLNETHPGSNMSVPDPILWW